jgi:hypothetical protein
MRGTGRTLPLCSDRPGRSISPTTDLVGAIRYFIGIPRGVGIRKGMFRHLRQMSSLNEGWIALRAFDERAKRFLATPVPVSGFTGRKNDGTIVATRPRIIGRIRAAYDALKGEFEAQRLARPQIRLLLPCYSTGDHRQDWRPRDGLGAQRELPIRTRAHRLDVRDPTTDQKVGDSSSSERAE